MDVDAVRDRTGDTVIGGVMEHVEQAGIHSGDSACVIPPPSLAPETIELLSDYTRQIADELDVAGPINVQYAVQRGQVFVIEANPRASRTVPFVAKATGRPMAMVAARVIAGATLAELRDEGLLAPEPVLSHWSVKEAVLPFNRFPGTDALLGPEMRSTGEVMGIDTSAGVAFVKSQLAAGTSMPAPDAGSIFLSLADRDKAEGMEVARTLASLGFRFVATSGTAAALVAAGLEVDQVVARLGGTDATPLPADAPDSLTLMNEGRIGFVINTPRGRGARADGRYIRTAAAEHGIPLVTTVAAARAAAVGLDELRERRLEVRSLQALHAGVTAATTSPGHTGGPSHG